MILALAIVPLIHPGPEVPAGVVFSIELKGASNNIVVISPKDSVVMQLKFANRTDHQLAIRIHDSDPYHGKLPFPVDCAVRITGTGGKLLSPADVNGGWYSQFLCWSTTFYKDDERNYRLLKPGDELVYEVDLRDVLTYLGPQPEEWPYNPDKGFRSGDYRFQFRYRDLTSEMFCLAVRSNKP